MVRYTRPDRMGADFRSTVRVVTKELEIRKTAGGRILAKRRDDAKQLTDAEKMEARYLMAQAEPSAADVTVFTEVMLLIYDASVVNESGANEPLHAIKLYSRMLDAHFWFIVDSSITNHDDIVRYHVEEIPILKQLQQDELKMIHQTKIECPGWIVVLDAKNTYAWAKEESQK